MSSISTVKHILRRYIFFGSIAAKNHYWRKNTYCDKKMWCSAYILLNWMQPFWNKIIFSDEWRLELHPSKRQYVRRPYNTRYLERYTAKTVKHGGKSLMVTRWSSCHTAASTIAFLEDHGVCLLSHYWMHVVKN